MTYYNRHTNVQNIVDLFQSLAFVPADKIGEVFDEVVEPKIAKVVSDESDLCPQELEQYFMYLESNYNGKFQRNGRRSKPRFPPDL